MFLLVKKTKTIKMLGVKNEKNLLFNHSVLNIFCIDDIIEHI